MADLRESYRLLEVEPGASPEEVKRAYRDLVKIWHPDRYTEDPKLQRKVQEKLKLINEAYEQICKTRISAPPRAANSAGTPSPEAKQQTRPSNSGGSSESKNASLNLVWIKPGTFMMGSPEAETGRGADEGPLTRVTLTQGYWLGATEVTQAQWATVMGSNPSRFKGANLPMERVSWNDAMAFCKKLTDLERTVGRLPTGYAYTLPTEAQWEYACRAGTTGAYAGNLDAMTWYGGNNSGTTHPVGTKQPNAWGLHDMHGNVGEWCLDRYAGLLSWKNNYPGGAVTDPTGPASGSCRVVRGGCWGDFATFCRAASRSWDGPFICLKYRGFRLALSSVR